MKWGTGMKDETGSAAVWGILLVCISAIMVAGLGALVDNEHRMIETDLVDRQARMVAEWAVSREYDLLRQRPKYAKEVLADRGNLRPGSVSGVRDGVKYAVYVGERHGILILWAVAENGEAKAQVGYCVAFDAETEQCCLKGMF